MSIIDGVPYCDACGVNIPPGGIDSWGIAELGLRLHCHDTATCKSKFNKIVITIVETLFESTMTAWAAGATREEREKADTEEDEGAVVEEFCRQIKPQLLEIARAAYHKARANQPNIAIAPPGMKVARSIQK